MKPTSYFFSLLLILTSCFDIGINDEIDKSAAKDLINKFEKTERVDSTLMEDANVQRFVPNGDYYLLINNSFNGDFGGLVYSKKGTPLPDSMKFDIFYVKYTDSIDHHWTSVSGGW